MQKYRFAYAKLRGRMAEKGYTITSLAAVIGISRLTLAHRLDNRYPFNSREMKAISDYLDIPGEQMASYFFAE